MTVTIYLFSVACALSYLSNHPVLGLSCAQCTPRDPACRSGNVRPTLCPAGASHCYVVHVYLDSGQGTFRGCRSSDMTEGCRQSTIRQGEVISCTTMCHWEGCNSSSGSVLSHENRHR